MNEIEKLQERRTLTCEEMGALLEEGAKFSRNLDEVTHDLRLTRSGKKLICALDFSEVHSYLWPHRAPAINRTLLERLLASKHLQFTMTPGATIELVRHLERTLAMARGATSDVRSRLDRPFTAAFEKNLETIRKTSELVVSLIEEALGLKPEQHRDIANLLSGIDKLRILTQRDNFVPFDQILERSGASLAADPDTYRECLVSLNFRRPGEPHNNHIDAHNYALLYSLSSQHVNAPGAVYYLITSARVPYHVFSSYRWGQFPYTADDPREQAFSLVRQPIHMVYLDLLLSIAERPEQVLGEMSRDLKFLLASWRNIATYQRYVKDPHSCSPTEMLRLPQSKRYLRHYLNYSRNYLACFQPAREAIETDLLAEENLRYLRGVSEWSITIPGFQGDESRSQPYSSRGFLRLLDRLKQLTLLTLKDLRSTLGKFPNELIRAVDIDGVILGSKALDTQISSNQMFNCKELRSFRAHDRYLCFAADLYTEYFASYWTGRVSFAEFIDGVRAYLAWVRQTPQELLSPRSAHSEKEFDGIYFMTADGKAPTKVPASEVPELNPEDLMDFAGARTEDIESIRVAMKEADFCYEFRPEGEVGPRIGFLSHCSPGLPLAHFIYSTNRVRIPLSQIRRLLNMVSQERPLEASSRPHGKPSFATQEAKVK